MCKQLRMSDFERSIRSDSPMYPHDPDADWDDDIIEFPEEGGDMEADVTDTADEPYPDEPWDDEVAD
jgi:hypothetical protein